MAGQIARAGIGACATGCLLLNTKVRIAFLIRRLDRGGAQRQLIKLARGLNKQKFDVTIVTLYAGGDFVVDVTPESGIRLICLDKSGRWDPRFLGRLLRIVRTLKPHIVHGYMSPANELSVLAGRACGARVVWGLRSSDLDVIPESFIDRVMFHGGVLLSRHADRIIANSRSGRSFHAAKGYCNERMIVIPNGIDTDFFTILPQQREAVRREWRVTPSELVIGRPARLDPVKDYPSFLKAAGQVSRVHSETKVVCVGDDTDCAELRYIADQEGITDRMIWAGGRADMPAVYNAFDLCISSSLSEGFPNAVAESMACGTPCVATAVGDSALLVGKLGVIVPSRDPTALADGIRRLIADRQQYSRALVRQRISDNFSLERAVASTEAEFERLFFSNDLAGLPAAVA